MELERYRKKRDFKRTPEPPAAPVARDAKPLIFVVQKHSASRLHYDFRLEVGGVLKSWAIPKGPSLDPQDKRLAVMVEDHPLEYGSFEGTIPEGEYGAGQVIVWDRGEYVPDEEGQPFSGSPSEVRRAVEEGLEKGKLSVSLRGEKLKGSWALVRMKRGENNWLFFKHRDGYADKGKDILKNDSSVLSGLTLEDLKSGKKPADIRVASFDISKATGVRRASMPRTIAPMLASAAEAPFSNPDWIFEPKLDGYRIIAVVRDGKARLLSRNGLDVTAKYTGIASSLGQQGYEMVLDGEIIALDKRGKQCFQCLQGYLKSMSLAGSAEEAQKVIYYVFDIVYLDGYNLERTPLLVRKEALKRALVPADDVRLLDYFEGEGKLIYERAVAQGLEGVVAKKKESTYEPGNRSAGWLKIKSLETEDFIIGGYTEGTGNRAKTFGSLLLGYYDNGKFVFAGHVGTGFNDTLQKDLKKKMDGLKTSESPFSEMPEVNAPATWVRPELVIEVKFSEWTQEGLLRQPVFLRLRGDKPPEQVRFKSIGFKTGKPETRKDNPGESETGILEQLTNPRPNFSLEVQGHRVDLTNLDKQLWPKRDKRNGATKRDFFVYLTKVSPYLLHHLKDRPLTLSRFPGGIYGEHFFQKHWHDPVPEFVVTVPLSERRGKQQEYILCNNLPTLMWLGQVADLEFHSWFSRISSSPEMQLPSDISTEESPDFFSRFPDFIVFDIDPYIYSGAEAAGAEPELNRTGFNRAGEAAIGLKEVLASLSLTGFIKTSGKTGLHIYVPVLRDLDYGAVHASARTICEYVERNHPEDITTAWAVKERTGKIFLDYNQNTRGKTLVSVYSPRATPEATVSCPISWDEVGKIYPTDFTIMNVPERLAKTGDLWVDMMTHRANLKRVVKLD